MDCSSKKPSHLRRNLILGTGLAATAVLGGYRGYVRRAYAACTGAGGTYTCSGVLNTTQTLSGAPLSITTAPGFGITTAANNAFDLSGTGGLSFTDNNASAITAAGTAINANNLTAGALSITTSGAVTGATDGIFAYNQGAGPTTITATGPVTGTAGYGIRAMGNGSATDMIITAADITGGVRGIYARNYGSGVLSITSTGTVTGTSGSGIYAKDSSIGTGMSIHVVNVSGVAGIQGAHYGTGAFTLTATGTVTGTTFDGINVGGHNSAMTTTTINAVDVSGADTGIDVFTQGTGLVSITTTGMVTGGLSYGIRAGRNVGAGITITAKDVSGTSGIYGNHGGTGALSITATGTVTGTDSFGTGIRTYSRYSTTDVTISAVNVTAGYKGIYARHYGTGPLSISALNVSGGYRGIETKNYGTGATSITISGTVTGTSNDAIYAFNANTATSLSINAANVNGGQRGIYAKNTGAGAISITSTGAVTGANGDGISVYGTGTISSLTISAANVTGSNKGIFVLGAAGPVSITSSGTVTGQGGIGLHAYTSGATSTLTIAAANVSGNATGINANHQGTGALSITAAGSVTGTGNDGIYAWNRNPAGGDLTINTANVSGASRGISVYHYTPGQVSITTTGTVTGTGNAGIFAQNNSANAGSVTSVMVASSSNVSGATAGIELSSPTGRGGSVINAGTITGSTGILATGSSATISNSGTITGSGGTAINLTGTTGPNTVNQQAGTISGAILLSASADQVHVTGGAINGNVTGQGNAALDFALGSGSFTFGAPYTIGGVNSVTLTSGTVQIDGTVNTNTLAVNNGTMIVNGTVNAIGPSTVAGRLSVNGLVNSTLTVQNGGILKGNGTVGATTIQSGGRLAPGNSPGTLHVAGDLSLSPGSILDYELGAPGTPGVGSDLTNVSGNLTLDGLLNVSDAGGFGAGVYRLINYNGALSDNGLDIGRAPPGYQVFDMSVQTSVVNQVNLVVGAPTLLNFWDGPNMTANGAVDGGTGVWNAINNNWTKIAGTPNGTYSPFSLLIFQASPGVVTIDNSEGAVSTVGMQFAVGGYTVTGGALTLNGVVPIRVGDGTAAGASYTTTIAADLIGTGSLEKTDLGTLILNGNNSFTGTTTVTAGTLVVNGSLPSAAMTVQSGAIMRGTGTVGLTTVQTGGTIAPGNSIGTLTVNGAFVQAAGSTYQVEVDPNSNASDRIAVNGMATITNGAALHVAKAFAGDYRPGALYTVLSATGGVNGTYALSGDTAASAFLNLEQTQDANNVYLRVVQTQDLAAAAQTPNQAAVAQALDSLPASEALPAAVLSSPTEEVARSAFDQLGGQTQASAKSTLISHSVMVRDTAFDRLREMRCGSQVGQVLNRSACDSDQPSLWAQGFGGWGGISGNANASGLNHSAAGMLAGFDLPVMDWRTGIFAGFSNSDFRLARGPASGESTDYHLGAYAGTDWDGISVSLGASYTWNAIRTDRAVAFGSFTDRLQGTYNAGITQVFAEAGYGMEMMGVTLEPFVNLAYLNLHTDGFAEAGGAAALTGQADTLENVITTFGIRPSTTIDLGSFPVTLRGMAGWRHTFGTVVPSSTVAFAGSSSFTVSGTSIARDAMALEAGVDFAVADNISAGLTYGGKLSSRTTDQTTRGTIRINF